MIRPALAVILCLAPLPALAQSTAPLTPPGAAGSGSTVPPTIGSDPGLTRGPVVHPADPDPAMTITPPQIGNTPIIPTPGMTGNGAQVIPK